jgi:hypothetical protein
MLGRLFRPLGVRAHFAPACRPLLPTCRPNFEILEDRAVPASLALQNAITVLPENADTTTAVRVADIVAVDGTLDSTTLSLSGPDAAAFEVDGAALLLKAGVALNFETNPGLDVTVNASDVDSAALSIAISDVNEPPSVTLQPVTTSLDEIHEERPYSDYHPSYTVGGGHGVNSVVTSDSGVFDPGIKMADIVVADDALGDAALSLSGSDPGWFLIYQSALYFDRDAPRDFETKPFYSVTVHVNDAAVGDGPDGSASFTLAINDINEKPMLRLGNFIAELNENTTLAAPARIADIRIIDDALGEETFSLAGTDAAFFEIVGNQLFMKAGTTRDFETKPFYEVTVVADDLEVSGDRDTTARLTLWLTDAPDLRIAQVRKPVVRKGVLTFTLSAANLGNPAANGVVALFKLPPELRFVRLGSSAGWARQGKFYRIDLGTLEAGQERALALSFRVPPGAALGKWRSAARIFDNGLLGGDDNVADNVSMMSARIEPSGSFVGKK